jgi:hypothetical protein
MKDRRICRSRLLLALTGAVSRGRRRDTIGWAASEQSAIRIGLNEQRLDRRATKGAV